MYHRGLLPSFPLYLFWMVFARRQGSILVWGHCSLPRAGSESLCFVSGSKAVRQIRQGALSGRLQEGFSFWGEQPNNCYYLQWVKERSILKAIRKGKVSHPAGKKAFKQPQTQKMGTSSESKHYTKVHLQITMQGVRAMCQALDIHYYFTPQCNCSWQLLV